ncbi:TorF family putative porin [Variovorax terrae]|uniref:TorF family putative porin n=1 Tax=Variovorax terrae TaxID=2923278 RepID=A0A9X1W0C7_9BURK|nr:TorF family putative porin [Variovorax terrae]
MKLKATQTMLLSLLAVSGAAFAQTAAPAAEPDYTLSYNIGAVTEYRYRGISQTGKKPALQGGIDFAHKSGFYLGTWGSTISWIKDSTANPNTTKGPIEIDLYGGYKGSITDSVSFDVGGLQYWYAGNNLGNTAGFANANTFELYGALSFGPVTAKYSQSTTNLFGTPNSKGSGYFDLSATFDLGNGFSIVPHIGSQTIKNATSYTDYSLALNKDFDGLVVSATLVGTNWSSKQGFDYTLPGTGTKNLAGSTLVLGLKKNF